MFFSAKIKKHGSETLKVFTVKNRIEINKETEMRDLKTKQQLQNRVSPLPKVGCPRCPKIIWNLRIKTEPVTAGADATIFVCPAFARNQTYAIMNYAIMNYAIMNYAIMNYAYRCICFNHDTLLES